nr:rna polymerase i termination factor [Quercus suber]
MLSWSEKLFRMGNASSQPSPYAHTKIGQQLGQHGRSAPTSPSQQAVFSQEKHNKHDERADDAEAVVLAAQESRQAEPTKMHRSKRPKARRTGRMRPSIPSEEPSQPSGGEIQTTLSGEQGVLHGSQNSSQQHETTSQATGEIKRMAKKRKDRMTLSDDEHSGRSPKRSKANDVNAKSTSVVGVPTVPINGSARTSTKVGHEPRSLLGQSSSIRRIKSESTLNGHAAPSDVNLTPSGRAAKLERNATAAIQHTTSASASAVSQIYQLVGGPTAGKFSEDEIRLIEAIFEHHRVQTGKGDYEMRALIEDWANVMDFKAEIEDMLPNRSKVALRKFCKRHFTTRNHGQWTKEEDRELLEAYQKYPGSWNQIADFVNRAADNCRSRYRNHLQLGSNKKTGPWSQEEEVKFVAIVNDCLAKIAAELASNSTGTPEDLINFEVVAQQMGNRSEQRCRDKWRKLTSQGYVEVEDGVRASLDPSLSLSRKRDPDAGDQTVSRIVSQHLAGFEDGDFFDVLTEIHTAFKNHNEEWRDESTLWSEVARVNKGSRFTRRRLRRAAYAAALEKFDARRKLAKQASTIPATAFLLAREIEAKARQGGLRMSRAYDAQQWKARSASISESRRSFKSPEIVVDSSASTPQDAADSDADPPSEGADDRGDKGESVQSAARGLPQVKEEPTEEEDSFDDVGDTDDQESARQKSDDRGQLFRSRRYGREKAMKEAPKHNKRLAGAIATGQTMGELAGIDCKLAVDLPESALALLSLR